jgi:hypothetical protein
MVAQETYHQQVFEGDGTVKEERRLVAGRITGEASYANYRRLEVRKKKGTCARTASATTSGSADR